MEYTDEYVHVNATNAAINATTGALEVVISYDSNRPPYVLVEVVAATVLANANTSNTFVLMAEEIANNIHNSANKGTTLALIDYNSQLQAGNHNYDITGFSTRAMFSNARTIHLYFTDEAGDVVLPAAALILGFNIMLKISRPVVGSIQAAYRSQVPL
jgi:hypothetical protein